jgi:hypothetical protein
MTNPNIKKAMTEELAVEELSKFLQKYKKKEFRKGQITNEKILQDYPDVIEAIQDGLIVFDDKNHLNLELRYPIVAEGSDRDLDTKVVEFRTRIKPTDKANLMDGLNIQTQQAKYVLRYIAYITGLSQNELDKLESEDYDVINQICSVF